MCERELLVGNVREREGERGHYRQMTVFVHHIVMIVWVHTHIIINMSACFVVCHHPDITVPVDWV